jgi:hypothetical protein
MTASVLSRPVSGRLAPQPPQRAIGVQPMALDAQPVLGQLGGPLPVPSPWQTRGAYISYPYGGVTVGVPTGGNKGLGTINAQNLYVQGVALSALMPPKATMEGLTVSALNTISNLSQTPDGTVIYLVVNGLMFFPLGPNPAFSFSGKQITWLSTTYSIDTTSQVFAVYTHL